MPTISEFHGIVIRMFNNDHAPPHLHATYGEFEGVVGLDPIAILAGRLPSRVEKMVAEWVELHRQELLANWERGQRLEALQRIDPLP